MRDNILSKATRGAQVLRFPLQSGPIDSSPRRGRSLKNRSRAARNRLVGTGIIFRETISPNELQKRLHKDERVLSLLIKLATEPESFSVSEFETLSTLKITISPRILELAKTLREVGPPFPLGETEVIYERFYDGRVKNLSADIVEAEFGTTAGRECRQFAIGDLSRTRPVEFYNGQKLILKSVVYLLT